MPARRRLHFPYALQDYNIRHYIIRRARDSFRANRAAAGADATRLLQEVRAPARRSPQQLHRRLGGVRAVCSRPSYPCPAHALWLLLLLLQGASSLALIGRQSTIAGFYAPAEERSVMEQWEERQQQSKGGASAGRS